MCKERLAERPFRKVNGNEVVGRSKDTKLKANEVCTAGWRLLVRDIKSWAVTGHSSMTGIKLQLSKWFRSWSLISNARWANSLGPAGCLVFILFYMLLFCFVFSFKGPGALRRRVRRKGRGGERRAGLGSVPGMGGGGWSVGGHFVPCLIFVFT